MEKKIDFILNVIESIICVLAVLVFTVCGVEIKQAQRFIFIILDFYCAIRLANCFDLAISYIKSKKVIKYSEKNIDAKLLNNIMYWS